MKPIIIIFLMTILALTATAQDTFELIIEGPLDQKPNSIIEKDDNYIISTLFGMYSSMGIQSQLFKIDKQGRIALTKIVKPETYEFLLTNIISNANGRFTGFGFQKVAEDSAACFTILEMDDDFSILTERNYQTDFHFLEYINVEKYNDYFLVTGSGKYTSNPLYHLFSYKINFSYDTLMSKVYPEEGTNLAFDLIPTLNGDNFKVFTRGYNQQTNAMGQIIRLDKLLDMVEYAAIPEYVFSFNDAMYIDESHYLLSGKADIFDNGRSGSKLAIMLMDTNDVLQDIKFLGPADTTNYPGFYSNLDFRNPDNIFYAGIKNLAFGYFIPASSWLFLNKLNSNLEVQWQKFYGGDANYNLWNLIATQDGGCLMAGTRYDYITQTNLRDVYILKVNSEGIVTGFGDEPSQIPFTDAIVYPNPGSTYLKVESGPQIDGALFELFDMSGKAVFRVKLRNRLQEINTSSFLKGTYTYRVSWKNKLVMIKKKK
jgi:hypothetical protein